MKRANQFEFLLFLILVATMAAGEEHGATLRREADSAPTKADCDFDEKHESDQKLPIINALRLLSRVSAQHVRETQDIDLLNEESRPDKKLKVLSDEIKSLTTALLKDRSAKGDSELQRKLSAAVKAHEELKNARQKKLEAKSEVPFIASDIQETERSLLKDLHLSLNKMKALIRDKKFPVEESAKRRFTDFRDYVETLAIQDLPNGKVLDGLQDQFNGLKALKVLRDEIHKSPRYKLFQEEVASKIRRYQSFIVAKDREMESLRRDQTVTGEKYENLIRALSRARALAVDQRDQLITFGKCFGTEEISFSIFSVCGLDQVYAPFDLSDPLGLQFDALKRIISESRKATAVAKQVVELNKEAENFISALRQCISASEEQEKKIQKADMVATDEKALFSMMEYLTVRRPTVGLVFVVSVRRDERGKLVLDSVDAFKGKPHFAKSGAPVLYVPAGKSSTATTDKAMEAAAKWIEDPVDARKDILYCHATPTLIAGRIK